MNLFKKIFLFFIFIYCFGQPVISSNTPNRVISLSPYATEIIYDLGEEKKLVGVTIYCNYPIQAKTKPKVGTLNDPNIEAILKLKPDLIIVSREDQSKEKVLYMKKLGLNILILNENKNFDDICNNYLKIAKVFNKENYAERKINFIKEGIENTSKLHWNKYPKVFCIVGENPLVTVSKGSFLDEIIQKAGGINIVKTSVSRYPIYNKEEVIKQNPDVIIYISMDNNLSSAKEWNKFKQINAVKNKKVIVVDADRVCRSTPDNYFYTLKLFYKILH
jgi:iron complex transport system substrate-binding protein